jgi:hypothetical protein
MILSAWVWNELIVVFSLLIVRFDVPFHQFLQASVVICLLLLIVEWTSGGLRKIVGQTPSRTAKIKITSHRDWRRRLGTGHNRGIFVEVRFLSSTPLVHLSKIFWDTAVASSAWGLFFYLQVSPMLSVTGLTLKELQPHISKTNNISQLTPSFTCQSATGQRLSSSLFS